MASMAEQELERLAQLRKAQSKQLAKEEKSQAWEEEQLAQIQAEEVAFLASERQFFEAKIELEAKVAALNEQSIQEHSQEQDTLSIASNTIEKRIGEQKATLDAAIKSQLANKQAETDAQKEKHLTLDKTGIEPSPNLQARNSLESQFPLKPLNKAMLH